MKSIHNLSAFFKQLVPQLKNKKLWLATIWLFSTNAMAAINLPMGAFFCDVASALQSQWAPGIIMIMIIVEGFLFMVVKKGILQMLMVTVLAATIIFGAAKFLNMIQPNAGCAATASISFNMNAA